MTRANGIVFWMGLVALVSMACGSGDGTGSSGSSGTSGGSSSGTSGTSGGGTSGSTTSSTSSTTSSSGGTDTGALGDKCPCPSGSYCESFGKGSGCGNNLTCLGSSAFSTCTMKCTPSGNECPSGFVCTTFHDNGVTVGNYCGKKI